MRPFIPLAIAAALTLAGCTIRTTPDGGIAVAPAQNTPTATDVSAMISGPPEPAPSEPAAAPPEGQCSANRVAYGEWLAATIKGDTPGSRVNVRPQPSLAAASGSYGLVGDAIAVIGEATEADCDRWYQVQFPNSGHKGWVFSDFVVIKE
jgi:hypothetical protein